MRVGLLAACGCALLLVPVAAGAEGQHDLYRDALAKFNAGQYDQALSAAREAVRQEPEDPARLHLYGLICEALRQFAPAEESLRKAASLAPNDARLQFDFAYLLHQERRYAEAVPLLKKTVELAPGNLAARLMLARSYVFSFHELQLANFTALALDQLNFIVKQNPRFPAVHHHLALIYINSGEPAKALQELRTELQYYPGNVQARLELGETLLKLNQPATAIAELQRAAHEAPAMYQVYYALAKAYKAEGKTAEAIEAGRRCAELQPRFLDVHYLLGQLYRDAHQTELANRHFALFREMKAAAAPRP